eukprot:jgi/Mesen1/10068/ME000730S09355
MAPRRRLPAGARADHMAAISEAPCETPKGSSLAARRATQKGFKPLQSFLAWGFCVLCIVLHAATVTGDVGTLGLLLAGASGVAGAASPAATPKFGADFGSGFPSFGPNKGAGHAILKATRKSKNCAKCDGLVLYHGWAMQTGVVRWQMFADLLIMLAYLSIPLQLYYALKKSLTEELDREVVARLARERGEARARSMSLRIRATLDRATVISTTLLELRDHLGLENVCLWMPSPASAMELAYECERRDKPMLGLIPFTDATGLEVVETLKAMVIPSKSNLARFSVLPPPRGSGEPVKGTVAAMAIPLLSTNDLAGGKLAELATEETTMFGLMTLVIPTTASAAAGAGGSSASGGARAQRTWKEEELQLVEATADQLAIAMSHAAVLEECRAAHAQLRLQEEALKRAELEGNSAVRARNNFLTVMKHEMRTPMHSITALSSLLAESDLEFEQREKVETVAMSSSLLSTLANDILDFWRLEDDTLSLNAHTFELPALVKEIETLVGPMAKDKGVKLVFKVEPNLPENVVGDSTRLLQVVLNVVSNSVKATSEGEVTVTVAREKMESLRDGFVLKAEAGFVFIRFEVRDTGPPIGPQDIPKLFDKFQDNEQGARSGLGLALSRKFVQIMVVDDNMVNRLVTKRLLDRIGCSCKVVDSGKECLRLLQDENEEKYNVMDGYTVANKVHAEIEESRRPVIVALTANADEHTKDLCLKHGMEGMITKPISLNTLRDVLGKMLDKLDIQGSY